MTAVQYYSARTIVFGSVILLATADAGAQWYDNYQDLESIYSKLDDFQTSNPDLASLFSIGDSYEGRAIRGIRISGTGGTKTSRPAVLINGTQHAREWIDPMTNMYAAEQLLEQYDTNSDLREMLDEVDFYVIPVVNPDGYEYSWTSTSTRYWRKNRRLNSDNSFGVDLNRNWDFRWGGVGSSGVMGSDLYRGTAPFSEPETQALRDFYYSKPNLVSNIDFHAYSQLILAPYGYSSTVEPEDADLMLALAEEMADSIQSVHVQTYIPESASDLYLASGISIDWTYGSENVYSYTIELRPAGLQQGLSGFALPTDQILPTAEEAFAAVLNLGVFTATLTRGDFNYDQLYTLDDLDGLTSSVFNGTSKAEYDVNGDAQIDTADILAWLENASEENLPSENVYLPGDANLDGTVDTLDLGIWNANQMTMTTDWSRGDFNTDGIVDGDDYSIWLSNAVPEPGSITLLLLGYGFWGRRRN